ncbi:hypothetical protein NPIL_294631 [Nephila pilipes]|uniref:Uncharacterized protein n=1 Tax=Nephila pilipes TaxID=299642 RepID=A0A8X6P342_NEPPI|nr:hypothetical protein NPIL_294631 [Nephila pilipes]
MQIEILSRLLECQGKEALHQEECRMEPILRKEKEKYFKSSCHPRKDSVISWLRSPYSKQIKVLGVLDSSRGRNSTFSEKRKWLVTVESIAIASLTPFLQLDD